MIKVMGQVLSMQTAFLGLMIGLIGAVVLVYLLLVVNYQSWVDPVIILMAIPGALTGIVADSLACSADDGRSPAQGDRISEHIAVRAMEQLSPTDHGLSKK